MVFDSKRHHRQSIRLKGYDYSRAGAYFVTICAKDKACLFGEIRDGIMCLNEYGNIVSQTGIGLRCHYPNAELDRFVVMPNHVHMILVLKPSAAGGAGLKPARTFIPRDSSGMESFGTNQPVIPKWHELSEIVRGFKTFSSRRINAIRKTAGKTVWHRNYYEHIIRNREDWGRVREYIATNPANWDQDEENPLCMPDERKKTLID